MRALPNNPVPDNQVEAGTRAGPRPFWLAGVVIAMGAVCLYGAFGLPQTSRYAAVGPGLFVTIAGVGLVILGILLAIQIARGEQFVAQDAEDAEAGQKADPRALILALAAACVPIVTIKYLGLPITATISFVLVAMAFGSKKLLMDIICGAVLGTAAWFLFSRLGLQLGQFLPVAGF